MPAVQRTIHAIELVLGGVRLDVIKMEEAVSKVLDEKM